MDDTNIESATVVISGGLVSGEDVLAANVGATGITASYNSTNGTLTLTGSATLAQYESVLESVTYDNTNDDNPNTTDRVITWTVNDGDANSAATTSTIDIMPVNDPPTVTDAGATVTYTESDAPLTIDSTLTVGDVDDTNIESATVVISGGLVSGEDVLAANVGATGISASYNSTNGTLTLTGSATLAQYESVLESVTYDNTNDDNPNTTDRVITWTVNDGDANSAATTSTIDIIPVNDPPTVTDAGATVTYTESDAPLTIDSTLTVGDVDDTNIESATVVISGGLVSGEDVLAANVGATGISASYNSTNGTLTLTGSATLAQYESVLESVTYDNTNDDNPNTTDRVITWTVNDGDANSAATTSTIDIIPVNDPPTVTDAGATVTYTESDAPLTIDSTLTVGDVDDTNIESATVVISGGLVSAEDVLAANVGATGISASYNSTNGTLTLTGSATLAQYESVLESVTYDNTNDDNPNTTDRVITWTVNDGDANSAATTSTIDIIPVNDPPTVTDAGATVTYTESDAPLTIDSYLNRR